MPLAGGAVAARPFSRLTRTQGAELSLRAFGTEHEEVELSHRVAIRKPCNVNTLDRCQGHDKREVSTVS
jgi:hypothetical protein